MPGGRVRVPRPQGPGSPATGGCPSSAEPRESHGSSLACLPSLTDPGDRRLAERYALLTRIREPRTPWRHGVGVCLLAEASADAEEAALGLEAIGAIAAEHREVFFAAEILRARGHLLARLGKPDAADACLRQAIETARGRVERSLGLRAATSLSGLLAGRGRRDEARAILEPVYAWFTDGLATADVREARTRLERLRPPQGGKKRRSAS